MGRIVTDWVLELGDSKAGLHDLISTVDLYNTTVKKSVETSKLGFSEAYRAQLAYNQQLVAAVQQQGAVAKGVEAGAAAIRKATDAEKQFGSVASDAAEAAQKALNENIAKQGQLTEAINASAAAALRSKMGGAQVLPPTPAASLPVPASVAVAGAVPSGSVAAVTEEFNRQIAAAQAATAAAQTYFDQVSEGAQQAKTAASVANDEVREAKNIYADNLQALRLLRSEEKGLAAARDNAGPGEDWLKANAALDANIAKQKQLAPIVEESKIAYQDAARAAVDANTALEKQNQLQQQAKVVVGDAANAQKQLEIASRAAIAAAKQQERQTGLLGQAEQKLTALIQQSKAARSKPELAAINREIQAVNEEIAAYRKLGQVKVAPTAAPGGNLLGGLIGSLGAAAAAFFTINKLIEVFNDGLRNAAELNGVKSAFNALTGSVEAGGREFAFLEKTSSDLGLELISTAQSYKLLFASAKEANLSVGETREIFSAIVSEGKVLGLSNQKVEASLRAVSQMLGKGVVSAEELRGQLGEALPDATAQAARALGVTTRELDVMLRKGQIISKDFLPKFAAEIKKTYGGATADAATQLQANLNRISNAYARFTAGLVGIFAPAIAGLAALLDGPKGQAAVADEAATAYERQASAIQQLTGSIPALVKEGEALSGKTNLNAKEQERLAYIIGEVGKAIPGAITKFDEYGKALGINSDAVDAFMKSNEGLGKRLREAALRENRKLLDDLEKQQQGVIARLNDTKNVGNIARLQETETFAVEGVSVDIKKPLKTQEESDKLTLKIQQQNADLLEKIAATRARIASIEGKANADGKGGKGGEIAALSIILELQKKIAALTEERSKVTEGPKTKANPFGGGEARIADYTAKIKAAQDQLDKLLGKEEKKVTDGRGAALKRLQAEELKLRKEYNKAVLDGLKDAGQARAAEQLRQDFNEIAAAEAQIKALEKEYAKAGGKGAAADGRLSPEKQAEVDALRILAVEKYNEEIARINREAVAKSLDLRVESDEKELAQLQAKYAEEIRVTQKANDDLGTSIETAMKNGNKVLALSLGASKLISDQLLKDLKAAAAEQERLLLRQQALNAIDDTEQVQKGGIEAGQVPIEQVPDVTADQSGGAQENATKRLGLVRGLYEKLFTLETDLEKQKQKALLQIQIDANNARLKQYENDFSRTGIKIKAGLTDANKALGEQMNALGETKTRKFDLMKLLGVAPEDQEETKRALSLAGSLIVEQIGAYAQAQVDAANKTAEVRKEQLAEARADLDQEIDMNKQGFASNVELRRKEVDDAKAARSQALDDQRKAIRAQQQLETVQQTVGLLTASVDILKGFANIPVVGLPLGIAAVAALFGFFTASKIKAASATKLEKGGLHGGERHANGGNKYVSVDGRSMLEVEEGEYTVNRISTRKHRELIEAINEDNSERVQLLALRGLLKGTGVRLNTDATKRIQRNQGAVLRESANRPLDLYPIQKSLDKIEKNTAQKVVSYETETHKVIQTGNHTRKIIKK
jgi:tape measure domain-containing protein